MRPDPRATLKDRLDEALKEVPAESPRRKYLPEIVNAIDEEAFSKLQQKYSREIDPANYNPTGNFKYLDVVAWLGHKLELAIGLGLAEGRPRRILDLGTGCGHFMRVCRHFGHKAIGFDIEDPLYADVATLLKVDRRIQAVRPYEKLPKIGKFDLITAFWINFNSLPYVPPRREYWNPDQWRFLVQSLIDKQLRFPGTVHFEMNLEYDAETQKHSFNQGIIQMFERWGASVVPERGIVTLKLDRRCVLES